MLQSARMATKKVKKAVIAAAGFGTRFLPQTKAMPKEMLPIVDKPVIQYIVEELVDAGIEDIVIVTGYHKRSIEDHFDHMSSDLRANLRQGGKIKLLEETKKISDLANFVYIRQKGPYGNGTPLLNAEHLIASEPFIYTWSDDFFVAKPSRFKQMISAYETYGSTIVSAVCAKTDADYDRYGFASGMELKPGVIDTKTIVEKPGKNEAPSDLATVSGFLLTPSIFTYLRQELEELQEGQEFFSNAALQRMIDAGEKVITYEIQSGHYFDAGNKLDYLKTVINFALEREDIGPDLRAYLTTILK